MELTDTEGHTVESSLNAMNAEAIAREIFSSFDLSLPTSTELIIREPVPLPKAHAEITESGIRLVAASETEARRAIGRLAIKKSWPCYKWMLATSLGLSVWLAILIDFLMLGSALLLWISLPPDLSLFGSVVVIIAAFLQNPLMLAMPIMSNRARYELEELMSSIDGISEFDAGDYSYADYTVILAIGFALISLLVILPFAETNNAPVLVSFFLNILVMWILALYLNFKESDMDRCKKYYRELYKDEEMETPKTHETPAELEIRETILRYAQELEFEGFENEEASEPKSVEVTFMKVSSPQCRTADYVFEDDSISFQILDLNTRVAKQLTIATLIWRHTVLDRGMKMPGVQVITGVLLPIALILLYMLTGFIVGTAIAIAGAIVFVWATLRVIEMDAGIEERAYTALESTALYSPYEFVDYARMVFRRDRRGAIRFIYGVVGFYMILILFAFWSSYWSPFP
ncbi:MAG: hypothetical protein JSW61_10895 [Candidatus Thorarchaeota archaeon]|nr:MAG: hypothetical protein JSW61_10895 [Candidatus Thorarchaeota archaeon]